MTVNTSLLETLVSTCFKIIQPRDPGICLPQSHRFGAQPCQGFCGRQAVPQKSLELMGITWEFIQKIQDWSRKRFKSPILGWDEVWWSTFWRVLHSVLSNIGNMKTFSATFPISSVLLEMDDQEIPGIPRSLWQRPPRQGHSVFLWKSPSSKLWISGTTWSSSIEKEKPWFSLERIFCDGNNKWWEMVWFMTFHSLLTS